MPRQQKKREEEQAPSPQGPQRFLSSRVIKFTTSPSPSGRLAFADVTINKDTFHLFDGLTVCSFVILRPKDQGGPRRLYVPGHKLPGGQNFRHLQGDTDDLREAMLEAYERKHGKADADASDEENFDEEHVDEGEMPF